MHKRETETWSGVGNDGQKKKHLPVVQREGAGWVRYVATNTQMLPRTLLRDPIEPLPGSKPSCDWGAAELSQRPISVVTLADGEPIIL